MARLKAALPVVVLVVAALGVAGCARAPQEGPPPAESLEIASAAPRALGALAGGTPAAPLGWNAPRTPDSEEPDDQDEDDDAGAPTGRDAGTSPEDLPL